MSAPQGPNPPGTGRPNDQREHPRAHKRLTVRFGVAKPEKTAFTKDISENGLYLKTNYALKPGTTLQVEIQDGAHKFAMWAKVAWAKKVPPQLAHVLECGMGLRFLEPTPEWIRFCRSRRKGN